MNDKINNEIIDVINEDIKQEVIEKMSSGITLLDLILGGGFGIGKVVNIVGDKSSGKTLLTIEFIAHAKKILGDKLKVFYDDCESGFSFNEEELFGMKIIEENQKNSVTIEDFQFNLNEKLESIKEGETLIYVVDSLDGLTCQAEIDRMHEEIKAREKGKKIKGTFAMNKQKKLSEIFRLMNQKMKNKRCILIVISQVRMNIGVMFGEKYTRSGGKALDFYASQIIWLSECEKMKKKEKVIGIRVKIRCKKNKLGKPFRNCYIDILFDYGVDNLTSDINYLYDLLTLTGKRSTKKVKWDEKEYTPAGLVKYIEENNLEDKLVGLVQNKWNDLEDSISSNNRKRKY